MRWGNVMLLVVVLGVSTELAHAQSRTTSVLFKMAVGGDEGYEEASVDVAYRFMHCMDTISLGYILPTGQTQVGTWYRWKSERHLVDKPAPKVSSVRFEVTVRSNGKGIWTGTIDPGRYGGYECLGMTVPIGRVKDLLGEKPTKDDIAQFVDSLSLSTSRIPYALRSDVVESQLRRDADEKERLRKEQEKREKDAADKKKKDEDEAKRLADEKQRLENEKAKLEEALRDQEADAKREADRISSEQDAQKPVETPPAASEEGPPGGPMKAPPPTGPTAEERIAAREKERADEAAAREVKDKERRAKTEWTEADEHDEGYWPESRCSYWDASGFISPPRGRHRCDPKFIKWVLEERMKQMAQDLEREQAELDAEQARQQRELAEWSKRPKNFSTPGMDAAGAIGGAGAAVVGAGAGASGGGSDDEVEDYRFSRGPSAIVPVGMLFEGGLVGGGLYAGIAYGLNRSLGRRLDARAKHMLVSTEYRCARGDNAGCEERDVWKRAANEATRSKLPWNASALLGPGVAYNFSLGYTRERRTGPADPSSSLMFDGSMHGLAIDVAWRVRFLRANVTYSHLRGDLFAYRDDDLRYTPSQGINTMGIGLAVQLGWSQLLSPYIGVRHRIDFITGEFADEFAGDELVQFGRIRNLKGGRTLGTMGVTLAFPPSFANAMFKSWTLNLEVYSESVSNIADGIMVTFGRQVWAPGWITELDGASTAGPDTQKTDAWFLPYIFDDGAGIRFVTLEGKRHRVTAVDLWTGPKPEGQGFGTTGVAAGLVGPRFQLPGGFNHALSLQLGPGFAQWTRDEIITVQPAPYDGNGPVGPPEVVRDEHVKVWSFGLANLAYRVAWRNYTLEAGAKFPLVWFESRERNTLTTEKWDFFGGSMPKSLYLGIGY